MLHRRRETRLARQGIIHHSIPQAAWRGGQFSKRCATVQRTLRDEWMEIECRPGEAECSVTHGMLCFRDDPVIEF